MIRENEPVVPPIGIGQMYLLYTVPTDKILVITYLGLNGSTFATLIEEDLAQVQTVKAPAEDIRTGSASFSGPLRITPGIVIAPGSKLFLKNTGSSGTLSQYDIVLSGYFAKP